MVIASPNEGILFRNVFTSLQLINFLLPKLFNKKTLEDIPSFSKNLQQDLEDKTTLEKTSCIKLFILNKYFVI
jgi:hypothetical protein